MNNLKYANKKRYAILLAIVAAALYAVSTPISKLLLVEIAPIFMAALLYLGAGIGMLIVSLVLKKNTQNNTKESSISKKDLKYVVGMIILDILAPFLLMLGLTLTNASNVSLLNNVEIIATTLIAMIFFKEAIGKRMWIAIIFILVAGIILSFDDISSFSLSLGSIFVIGATLCWGLENNCTRMLSLNNPLHIVVIKGLGSGIGAFIITVLLGELGGSIMYIMFTLLLGFVAYGMSIFLYITAQRELGAARTSMYYAIAPFIGVLISIIILNENLTIAFVVALAIMIIGTYFAVTEKHKHTHLHHELTHTHRHTHDDLHHNHKHIDNHMEDHNHEHSHKEQEHKHEHFPDMHHNHDHDK
ncbi:EamA family transporter [Mycoplasmatota bacterium WC30]